MTNDTRTADDIERDIEDERAEMSGTINDLHKKISVEGIVSDIGAMFRDQGGDPGRHISETVGRNPADFALVGEGLAWLLLGKARGASPSSVERHDRDSTYGGNWDRVRPASRKARADPRAAEDSWLDDGGMVHPAPSTSGCGINGEYAVLGAASDAAGAVRDAALDLTCQLSSGMDGLSQEAKARVLTARRAAVISFRTPEESLPGQRCRSGRWRLHFRP